MSGSVSRGKDNPSQSLQMIERQLMTTDELKSLPKGTFVVMKTGFYPMKVKMKLFFKWGITFEDEYCLEENDGRKVSYADKNSLIKAIILKYQSKLKLPKADTGADKDNAKKSEERPEHKNSNLRTSVNKEEMQNEKT